MSQPLLVLLLTGLARTTCVSKLSAPQVFKQQKICIFKLAHTTKHDIFKTKNWRHDVYVVYDDSDRKMKLMMFPHW